jgi:hypothetical protein
MSVYLVMLPKNKISEPKIVKNFIFMILFVPFIVIAFKNF